MEQFDHVVEKAQQETGERMLAYFKSDHLPATLGVVSQTFGRVAVLIVEQLPAGPERTVCLRKLLEAKDAGVRCALGLVLLLFIATTVFAQAPAQQANKVGWNQAEAPALASTYRYTLYVDNVATVLTGVTCATGAGTSSECKAPLPPLTVGLHTLELTAADLTDPTLPAESARSAPFPIRFYAAPAIPGTLRLTR